MHDILKERVWRRIQALPQEQVYQVLDYIEFLEAKYAREKAHEPDVLQKFAERVEDSLRMRSVAPKVISGTVGLLGSARRVMRTVSDAGRDILGTPPAPGSRPPATAPSAPTRQSPVSQPRQSPASRSTPSPASSTQSPASQSTQSPATQSPASQSTQSPAPQSTQSPESQSTQSPASRSTQSPASQPRPQASPPGSGDGAPPAYPNHESHDTP